MESLQKFWLSKTTIKLEGLAILLRMSLNRVKVSEPWRGKKTGWRGLCWSHEDENDVMFSRDGKWSHQASILTDSCWVTAGRTRNVTSCGQRDHFVYCAVSWDFYHMKNRVPSPRSYSEQPEKHVLLSCCYFGYPSIFSFNNWGVFVSISP